MKRKYLIIGYFGMGNIGDDMFLETFLKNISEIDSNFNLNEITVICKNSTKIKERLNVNVEEFKYRKNFIINFFRNIFFMLNLIRNHEFIIYLGGTQIQDYGKPKYKPLIIMAIYLLIGKIIFNKEAIHLSCGIDRLRFKSSKLMLRIICWSSQLFLVRDKKSYDYLLNFTKELKLIKSTDLAYSCKKYFSNSENESNLKNNNILISIFSPLSSQENNHQKQEFLNEELAKFIKWLIDFKKYNIELIPMQIDGGNYDNLYIKNFKNKYFFNNKKVSIFQEEDLSKLLIKIKSSKFCIGMRLHFSIFSLLSEKKIIGISYHSKVNYLYETYGLENYCIDIGNMSEKKLRERFIELENDKKYEEKVKKINEIESITINETFKTIKNIIQGKIC